VCHATNPTISHQFVLTPASGSGRPTPTRKHDDKTSNATVTLTPSPELLQFFRGDEKGTEDLVPLAQRAAEASPREMAGRRESPLMRGGGAGPPLSRGSRIAAAVVVGVALGCLCAFLYPAGLFPRAPDSASHWPRQVQYPRFRFF
jgi:hypothetical protein